MRIQRAAETGVAIEYGRSEVQCARIRGYRRVASVGMEAIGDLACEEAFWMRNTPHAAARLQAAADVSAMVITGMMSEAGRY